MGRLDHGKELKAHWRNLSGGIERNAFKAVKGPVLQYPAALKARKGHCQS